MDIAIMIEGQNGLNWPRWQRLVRAVEDLGFAGLYRSDHFTNGPPILIGGNGPQRTLPLVARYADEWNAVYIFAPRFAELSAHLDSLLATQGRPPEAVRRSLMTGVVFGRDDQALASQLQGRDAMALRQRGVIVGAPAAVQEQLGALAAAGVQRVMLQWLDLDDLDGLDALAASVHLD